MSVQTTIEDKIGHGLNPVHLEVVNESHQHNVPKGSESHFKVIVVTDAFEGKNLLARHRMVYGLVAEEMNAPIHALALHTYTPTDWQSQFGEAPMSPHCRGGKAQEAS